MPPNILSGLGQNLPARISGPGRIDRVRPTVRTRFAAGFGAIHAGNAPGTQVLPPIRALDPCIARSYKARHELAVADLDPQHGYQGTVVSTEATAEGGTVEHVQGRDNCD